MLQQEEHADPRTTTTQPFTPLTRPVLGPMPGLALGQWSGRVAATRGSATGGVLVEDSSAHVLPCLPGVQLGRWQSKARTFIELVDNALDAYAMGDWPGGPRFGHGVVRAQWSAGTAPAPLARLSLAARRPEQVTLEAAPSLRRPASEQGQGAVPEAVRELASRYRRNALPQVAVRATDGGTDDRPDFGQIWTTRVPDATADVRARNWIAQVKAQPSGQGPTDAVAPSDSVVGRLVVLLLGSDTFTGEAGGDTAVGGMAVAPISVDTAFWSDFDLLVDGGSSPLGYPFMVEVWNEAAVERGQLGRCLGALGQPHRSLLGLLYRARLGTEVDVAPLAGYVGPAITHDDDPRVLFQKRELAACAYLRRPLLAAAWELAGAEYEAREAAAAAQEVPQTLGGVVSLIDDRLAAHLPEDELSTLRQDPTPLTSLRDPKGLVAAIGDVRRRLGLSQEAARAVLNGVRDALTRLTASGMPRGPRPAYTRPQRGGPRAPRPSADRSARTRTDAPQDPEGAREGGDGSARRSGRRAQDTGADQPPS